jgi:GNAT superfamily N-acetyltransferase
VKIGPALLYDVIDATWPAAGFHRAGPWILREGRGGGKRVSSATADGAVSEDDIDTAERGLADLDQPALFMIRDGQAGLDRMLAARGYGVIDPVVAWACPVAQLTNVPMPQITVFAIWEPLAIMREMWAQGGIGRARLAVMDRVRGAKTGLLARYNDKPGGTAFVATHDRVAMLHALEILPHQRQQGLGKWMMRGAAFWAAEQGSDTLSVVCTRANAGANALYASLGMAVVGEYHYRHLTTRKDLP